MALPQKDRRRKVVFWRPSPLPSNKDHLLESEIWLQSIDLDLKNTSANRFWSGTLLRQVLPVVTHKTYSKYETNYLMNYSTICTCEFPISWTNKGDQCLSFIRESWLGFLQLRHPRYITSRYLRTMPRNCSSLEAPLLKLSDLRNAVLRTHLRSRKPAKIFLHFLPAMYVWGMKTEVDQTLQLDVFLRA